MHEFQVLATFTVIGAIYFGLFLAAEKLWMTKKEIARPVVRVPPPSAGSPGLFRQGTPLLLGLGLLVLVAACSAPPPPAPPTAFSAQAYRTFVVPQPLLPFNARGAAAVTYRGERETGELVLRGAQNATGPALALELRARVTGSLALELRFDTERLLVVDYLNSTYYQGLNDADTRLRLFEVDLTPTEFLLAVTGRVPRAWYLGGNGMPLPDGTRVVQQGPDTYFFHLDEYGLPQRWEKHRAGRVVLRVEYRAYADLPINGDTLRLPRQIRVYLEEDVPRLVLGFAQFSPGDGGLPAPDPATLPDAAQAFAPVPLPPPAG